VNISIFAVTALDRTFLLPKKNLKIFGNGLR